MTLREDAKYIIDAALKSAMPDTAVEKALKGFEIPRGKLVLVSAGKAGWQMAKTAADILGDKISCGAVVTKYDHVKEPIPGLECYEAGHPVPDENSFKATERVIELVKDLTEEDAVIFLLSGGGSALFEKPLCSGEELQDVPYRHSCRR